MCSSASTYDIENHKTTWPYGKLSNLVYKILSFTEPTRSQGPAASCR